MSVGDDGNGAPVVGAAATAGVPPFARELAGTLAVHSQYVLHGNIRDQFLLAPTDGVDGTRWRLMSMLPMLWNALQPSGYICFVCYDPVDGVTVYPDEPEVRRCAELLLGPDIVGRRPSLGKLRSLLAKVVGAPEPVVSESEPAANRDTTNPHGRIEPPRVRAAFIVDYAARIATSPGHLDASERDFFLYCQKLARTVRPWPGDGPRPSPLYNPIVWLVEGERDLPAWLTAGVERIRTVAIGLPSLGDRLSVARILTPLLVGPGPVGSAYDANAVEFANRTDGMTLQAMVEIVRLAKDRGIAMADIADAVRIYKLGVEDNPWRRTSVRKQIEEGERTIFERIKGQDLAVSKTLDILKRAALGLSGAQATSRVSRPRGVLFFAGPTGVGKTEMAKQVASILFGDANSYLRFDMSEFSADHAADRLTGAPPGYVGFEAGGELTGAVRRKPFQVVLFDEIEKAHPLVLDKFLQILEDGRLTDGQGITTYFSECVLIFTSNLGVVVTNSATGQREQIIAPGMPYEELETRIKAAIREHFTTKIGRPELLNRFGDNIVVFDFISAAVAQEIFELQLNNVVARTFQELGIRLHLEESARRILGDLCTMDTSQGGRGIGNRLESSLINPLARYIFESDCIPGSTLVITSLGMSDRHAVPVLEAHVKVAP